MIADAPAAKVAPVFDLTPAAGQIASLKQLGRPVANVGKYHGQYQFLGRLDEPLDVISGDQIAEWFARNPDGVIIAYHRNLPELSNGPFFTQPFRGKTLALWNREEALTDPELFIR